MKALRPRAGTGALAVPEFRVYLLARLIAMVGTSLSLVALPILAYQLTGSAALTALLTRSGGHSISFSACPSAHWSIGSTGGR